MLGRDGEDVAAGTEDGPLAVRARCRSRRSIVLHVLEAAAAGFVVVVDLDVDLLGLFRRQVELEDPAAALVDDRRIAERRELDVVILVVRELLRFVRLQVEDVQVHPPKLVAVGGEVNLVPVPHRDDFLVVRLRQLLRLLRGEVVQPEVVGHAAAVALPGAELAEDAVVDELGIVRRKGAEAAAGQRQLLRQAAVDRNREQLTDEIIMRLEPRAEHDRLIVVLPAHDDVVRPHAVGHVVAAEGRGPGQPAGRAAVGRHDVNLGVAVVLAGEREPFAVGRKPRKHLEPVVVRDPAGDPPAAGTRYRLPGVGECHPVAVNRGEPQQTGFGGGCSRSERHHDDNNCQVPKRHADSASIGEETGCVVYGYVAGRSWQGVPHRG